MMKGKAAAVVVSLLGASWFLLMAPLLNGDTPVTQNALWMFEHVITLSQAGARSCKNTFLVTLQPFSYSY
jgi:hypothetical protein